MIVYITKALALELSEPENCRAFKVVVDLPKTEFEAVRFKWPGTLVFDGADNARVSITRLKNWSGLEENPEWQRGLAAMIVAAEPYGWIDQCSGSIKAHVEWTK